MKLFESKFMIQPIGKTGRVRCNCSCGAKCIDCAFAISRKSTRYGKISPSPFRFGIGLGGTGELLGRASVILLFECISTRFHGADENTGQRSFEDEGTLGLFFVGGAQ